MKRDMDLAREILFAIENSDCEKGWAETAIAGRSAREISYHVKLLSQAGLITAIDCSTMMGDDWKAESLTWAGHEFLDASRKTSIWERAKALVLEKTGGLSFEALKATVIELAKQAVS